VVGILRVGFLACLLGAGLFVSVVQAGSFSSMTLPSTVSFSIGGDAEGSRDSYFDLDYAFVDDSRLLFSSSSNRSDSQDNPITTRSVLLGFRTDPLARFSAGVDLEHWGEEDTFVTDTLRVVMDVSLQYWQFSLRPQWRTLTFTTDCVAIILPQCDPEVKVKSTGAAFDVSYFSDGPWSFSLGFARHDYDKDIQALAQHPVFQLIFSAATLDLSAGLEEQRSSAGVSYFSGDHFWSFSRMKSVSAVTGVTSFVNTLRYSTELNKQWRLSLNMGGQTLENGDDRVGFAGAGLAYSW
jgi:hypothetical protein